MRFDEHYFADESGNRKAAEVPVSEWEQIVEASGELDDIRACDEADQGQPEVIPFEGPVSKINGGISD